MTMITPEQLNAPQAYFCNAIQVKPWSIGLFAALAFYLYAWCRKVPCGEYGAVLILVSVVQGYNADLTAYYEKQGVNKVNVSIINFDRTNTVDQSGEFMDWVSESLSDQITGVTPSTSTSGTLK